MLDRLITTCLRPGIRSLAVVGLVKNAGKTTVVNAVAQALMQRLILGLVSAGRDGEPLDMLTELPKPRITVGKGTLVVTAAGALEVATAGFDVLDPLGFRSAMGPLVVARCVRPGRVELIGPPTASHLARVIRTLTSAGADFVLCDGAFDRRASAAPTVTDALIIATGAALSPDMNVVVEKTGLTAQLYRLPPVRQLIPHACSTAPPGGAAVAVLEASGNWEPLGVASALGHGSDIAASARNSAAVYIGGALVSTLLEAFGRADVDTIIVHDATHIFVDWATYSRYRKSGGRIGVVNPANLLAVTVNPWSPVGPPFDAAAFVRATAEAVAPVLTIDVVSGVHCQFS